MKYDNKTIGKRIKAGRNACRTEDGKKYTQEDLTDKLHYKRETISRWENGKELPTLETLLKMCDIFGCDLGYLLGEHEEKTRTAADIHTETGLSEDAIQKLQSYDKTPKYEQRLSPGTNAVLDQFDLRQYTQPELFTQKLLSYILTNENFENLVNRICSQNISMIEYILLPDVEKEIITASYKKALHNVGSSRADNIGLIQQEYEKAVEEYMTENKEEIQKRLPNQWVEGGYEMLYIEGVKRHFHLARMTSDRIIEMNNFLNSNDLFNILTEFMEPITKMQNMKEV